MQDVDVVDDDGSPIDAICNWLSYIGAGYRNLQVFNYDSIDNLFEDKDMVQEPLRVAMTNLTKIKNPSLIYVHLQNLHWI